MTNSTPLVQLSQTQPVRIADVRQVPLDQLPDDAECGDMVMRVMGRQQYTWRVDVASFDSTI